MRHIVATLIVAGLLVVASSAVDVYGQDGCSFVGGFARLRELVGSDKIGNCLEDEHFNAENGNAEQRTTGGLFVWRKADNFTAFTDGGTTWVNGPDGLQSRPNNERFSWEKDPVTSASTAPVASSASPATPTPTVAASPAAASPVPAAAAPPAPPASPTPTATPAATPTKTPTPTPAVTAKWRDKPDDVDTGTDVHFEVETNASKGTCSLGIAFRNTADAGYGSVDIDDGKCEWDINIPPSAKTGKAKVHADVAGKEGSARVDDEFDVKEGNQALAGDMEVDVEGDDLPDEVKVGEQVKIAVKSNVKKRGRCEMSIAWPDYAATAGENQEPDGNGKCSWTVTVPAEIPKKGNATLTVTVRKSTKATSTEYRTLTYDFDVKK
jgi:hypothetical protein